MAERCTSLWIKLIRTRRIVLKPQLRSANQVIIQFAVVGLVALTLSACDLQQSVPSRKPTTDARQLVERGFAYYGNQEYAQALEAYHEALSDVDGSNDPMVRADIYYKIGRVHLRQQRYEHSLAAFQNALALVKESGTRRDEAMLRNGMGMAYQALGQAESARDQYRQELSIRREVDDQPGEVRSLVNLGSTYFAQGRYAQALELYEQAKNLSDAIQPRDLKNTGAILTHIGSLYAELGQYDRALTAHEKALKTYQDEDDQSGVATALHNIGYTHAEQRHYSAAIAAFRESVSLRTKLQDQFGRADTLNSLGLTLAKDGQASDALEMLNEALKILQGLNTRKQMAATLDSIGSVYKRLGDYSKALGYYNQSLVIWRQLDDRDGERITLGNIGSALELQKKVEPAIIFYKMSINITQAIRTELTVLPKQEQRAYLTKIEDNYRRLADLLIDRGRLSEAEQVLTMLKEEEFFEFIRRRSDQAGAVTTAASYTETERPWAERYAMIHGELVAIGQEYEELLEGQKQGLNADQVRRLEQLVSDMRVARAAVRAYIKELEAAFIAQDPHRAMEFGEKELKTLRQVQVELKNLGPGSILIHTFVTDERLRLLLTTRTQQVHRDSSITWKELNRLIANFRKVLQDPHSDPMPQAQEIYGHLMAPLEADLRQAGARTLLISLDDTLRYLPIAALHDGKRYLSERYGLVVYTAAARRHLATRPQSLWRVAGMGVSESAGEEFGALPAVRRELNSIVREEGRDDPLGVLPGVVRIDSEFTPEQFSGDLRAGYPVVHIASHFKFQPGNEADSFVLLGSERKLTLADIQDGDYPLTEVDLLTLSACETAYGGRDAHGREIESFGVLAQQQGAKAVLATLWPVADSSTAEFMAAFYRRRQQGMSKAEALRRTQVAFLRGEGRLSMGLGGNSEGRGALLADSAEDSATSAAVRSYAHPYYWAPFILMGNYF